MDGNRKTNSVSDIAKMRNQEVWEIIVNCANVFLAVCLVASKFLARKLLVIAIYGIFINENATECKQSRASLQSRAHFNSPIRDFVQHIKPQTNYVKHPVF